MTDRTTTVTIGAVLASNFRTSFREATREVQNLSRAVDVLGGRRSNAGLFGVRDATSALAVNFRRTGTEATTAARSLENLTGRASRAAPALRTLATDARSATTALTGLSNAFRGLDTGRGATGFNSLGSSAQGAVRRTRELRDATTGLSRSFTTLDGRLTRSTALMGDYATGVRSASQATGGLNRSVQGLAQHLAAEVAELSRVASGLQSVVNATNAAAVAQGRLNAARGAGAAAGARGAAGAGGGRGGGGGGHGAGLAGGALGAAAGHAAGHALFGAATTAYIGGHALAKGFEAAAEYQHELIVRKQQGWSKEEIAHGQSEARRVARTLRMFSERENLEALGDLAGALGSKELATEHLMGAQRSGARLKQVAPNMDTSRNAFGMIKALEMMGHTKHDEVEDYMDKMTSASVFFNGKITGEDYRKFALRAGGAGNFYSQDFMTTILPSIMQEMTAETAGTSMRMVRSALIGGRMTRAAANTLNEFGLMDPSKTDGDLVGASGGLGRNAKGHGWIRGLTKNPGRYTDVTVGRGAIVDADLLQENPYEWVKKHLQPVYDSVGKDPKKMGQILSQMFSNSSAERAVSIMLLQQQRLEKDRKQILDTREASSFENVLADPKLAGIRLGKAFEDMNKSVFAATVGPIAGAMDRLGDAMYKVADANPETIAGFVKMGAVMVGLPAVAWASQKAFLALGAGFRSIMGLVRSPMFLGFAAAGYLIYKNWDWVSTFASSALPGLSAGFERVGNVFDSLIRGGENVLRFFGLIPDASRSVTDSMKQATDFGTRFGDFLSVALPAAAALWAGTTAVRIASGFATVATAIMGVNTSAVTLMRGPFGQLLAMLALAETAKEQGVGQGGNAPKRGILDYFDSGLGNFFYGKEAPVPNGDQRLLYQRILPDFMGGKPAPGGAVVQPQSYGGGSPAAGGLIHPTSFDGSFEGNRSKADSEDIVRHGTREGMKEALRDAQTGGFGGLIHKASFDGGGGFGGNGGIGSSMGGAGGGFGGGGGTGGGGFVGAGGGGGGSGGSSRAGGASMPELSDSLKATPDELNKLGLIYKYEGGGKNQMNYVAKRTGLDPTTAKGATAQGYFQILNSNWRRIAPRLGIKTGNAMASSLQDQARVALALMRENPNRPGGGIQNWTNYNPRLRAAIARGEIAQRGNVPEVTPGGPGANDNMGGSSVAADMLGKSKSGNLQGTVDVEGTSYNFGSGGGRSNEGNSIPFGTYPITPNTIGPWGRANNAIGINNNAIYDKTLGRMRTGIEFHAASNANKITAGCIGIAREQYGAFRAHVLKMVKEKGQAFLTVGPDGRATITSERPGSNAVSKAAAANARSAIDVGGGLKGTPFGSAGAAATSEAAGAAGRAAINDAAKANRQKVSPGAGGKTEINAPITINPHPNQSPADIGREAANHIGNTRNDAAADLRSGTYDWVA